MTFGGTAKKSESGDQTKSESGMASLSEGIPLCPARYWTIPSPRRGLDLPLSLLPFTIASVAVWLTTRKVG